MESCSKVLFTTGNAARLCAGEFAGFNSQISNVQISSSSCSFGSLFVALKGEKTDGHKFIFQAIEKGASSILLDNKHYAEMANRLRNYAIGIIIVNDTLQGLQKLAENYIAQFDMTRIGITGSCGKTTTKEILSSILSEKGYTSSTPGNLNSEVGLALSVFTANSKSQFGIYEMGIDKIGEMDTLNRILKPEVGVLTNIYSSHLEKFGTVNNLVKEKSKIFKSYPSMRFLYEDCNYKNQIIRLSKNSDFKLFGINQLTGLTGFENLGLNGWIINYCNRKIHLKVIGWHSLVDAIAAIKVSRSLGANINDIAQGLEKLDQINGRSRVYKGSRTIIDDSYNASYESGYSILDLVKNLSWNGQKKLVMGSMKELGYKSEESHKKLAKKMAEVGAQKIYLYGEEMKVGYDYLKHVGLKSKVFFTLDFEELEEKIIPDLNLGDLFLLKGSRAMRMERLLPIIESC